MQPDNILLTRFPTTAGTTDPFRLRERYGNIGIIKNDPLPLLFQQEDPDRQVVIIYYFLHGGQKNIFSIFLTFKQKTSIFSEQTQHSPQNGCAADSFVELRAKEGSIQIRFPVQQ